MTNMLPRDRAELIMAEHAAGKSIREIAAAYGHSTQTVRDYVLGRRTPGEPAARDDDFAPFAAYCRRRLADDPHLRAAAQAGIPGSDTVEVALPSNRCGEIPLSRIPSQSGRHRHRPGPSM